MQLLAFDIESTGLNPFEDRIVELSFIDCDSHNELFHQLFDPGMPIPQEAQEVHGIANSDVRDKPLFAEYAVEVQELVSSFCLVGYGSRDFDSLLLDAELQRAGQPGIRLSQERELDLLTVWRRLEPRSLEGAVQRFLGREHEGAHRATADAKVIPELLAVMASKWDLDYESMARITAERELLDEAKNLRWDEQLRKVVFNFGKYEGEPVGRHPEYLEWMLEADFPISTKRAVRILQKNEFVPPGTE